MNSAFDLNETFVPPVCLDPMSTAIAVVDMQYTESAGQGFNLAVSRIYPGSMDYFNERNEALVVPAIARFLGAARVRGMRVIFITLGADSRDLREFPARMRRRIRDVEVRSGIKDLFWRESSWAGLRRELGARPEELVLNKTSFGAFNGSELDSVLRGHGIESLILTGVSTSCCVETTARDAADRGYGCILIDECCADYDQSSHDATLRRFHLSFGRVAATVDEVIAAIDGPGEL